MHILYRLLTEYSLIFHTVNRFVALNHLMSAIHICFIYISYLLILWNIQYVGLSFTCHWIKMMLLQINQKDEGTKLGCSALI